MLQKGESQRRAGRENIQKRQFRTSWVQTSGVDTIPKMEWACPPRFVVDPDWDLEVGSQSKETDIQLQRESKTPEAIYYVNSDIPANPCIASDALVFNDDNSKVPIIPLVAIDDDDKSTPLTTLDSTVKVGEPTTPLTVSPLGPPQVKGVPEVDTQALLQRNQVMGMAVALFALMKAKEPGSQVDLELLAQIFSNPGMLEQLLKENGDPAKPQVGPSLPSSVPKPSLEVRPARTVVESTPVAVPGPSITHVIVPKPSLEVWPARTVVKRTPVAVPGPTITHVVVPKLSLEVWPARTVVETTLVAVPGPNIKSVIVPRPSLEVKPARTVVGTTPVVVPGPNIKPVTVPKPPLEVRPTTTAVGTTPVAVPGPYIKSIAKVPVAAQSTWAPSVPFAHSISQGVKNTIEQIHRNSGSQSTSLLKVDLGKIRKLINEYGVPFGENGNSCSPYAPKTGPVVIKDLDYYRGLVSQHGITQENRNLQGSVKTIGSSEQRACLYFNSPKGCRRGFACLFQHVKVNMEGVSRAVVEPQAAKRMKLSGGIFAGHR